jgi:hypothetical protein
MKHLALCALLLCPQEKSPQPLAVGAPAPDFDVPGVDGKRYALKDFADRKVLLVLFDTVHCPTSQNYTARVKKLWDDYRDRIGMVVISPNHPKSVRLDELGYSDLDDSFESLKLRAKDKDFRFPFCFDGEPNRASQAYGPKATPHAFLFDADRKLRYQGGIDDNEWEDRVKAHHLRNAIDALLEGKPVPVEIARVFGCSTKWPNKQAPVAEYNARIAAEPVAVEPADAAAVKALRRNDSGKVRLVHVWSPADASQLPALVEMNHMYRRRNFALTTVAVAGPEKRDEALAALKRPGAPAASNKNLLVPDLEAVREALDAGWDGAPPFTLVLSDKNEILYKKTGAVDALECRRAIVRNLKEDRRR